MGKREPKEVTQRKHALRRARDRFDLTEADVNVIEKMIRGGQTTVVERQSIRRVVHRVVYNDVVIHVVYDTTRSQAATFLYPEGDPLDALLTLKGGLR